MTNLEKYDMAFVEVFGVEKEGMESLEYQGVKEWDSIGHMGLIAELEDRFDIEIETDDIIDFSSYKKGKEILNKYGIDL